MNKKPVFYLQTDSRWKALRLPCNGGTMSLGGGGCGPTSAAMLIETLTGKTCLPTEAFGWACKHGYVYANQGTSYDYFTPQFRAYGLECDRLSPYACLSSTSKQRDQVIAKLQDGYYFIALMKKGLWTSGGHYIVVWGADDKIRINDPASTRYERLNGDPDTFFLQAKYFWWIDARYYNKGGDDEVDIAKFINDMTPEQADAIVRKAEAFAGNQAMPVNWDASEQLADAIRNGITDGTRPMAHATRLEAALMANRAAKMAIKELHGE